MSDPLYELLAPQLDNNKGEKRSTNTQDVGPEVSTKYLSRLLSLHLADLTTTEPQSIAQATQSNLLSIQALSSRSHKTTTLSSDHLSTLKESLPHISNSTREVRESIPALDESAVTFASAYSKSRDSENPSLVARREAQLLARQADKLQEILELPSLLSAAIASAGSGAAGSANYSQALDLFAHIKRLQIIFPDSKLIESVLGEAEIAMKEMTANFLTSLRSQNIRLAAAIRTIGWLRRVVPELSNLHHTSSSINTSLPSSSSSKATNIKTTASMPFAPSTSTMDATATTTTTTTTTTEGSFGALFLVARLATFISMTQALAPLRELADQESERRLQQATSTSATQTPAPSTSRRTSTIPSSTSTASNNNSAPFTNGHQTERYLKRYIEIFREQSFSTISMYRNIFPTDEQNEPSNTNVDDTVEMETTLASAPVPPSLQTFPLHLVEMLMEVLRMYLPNITDTAARESLLMQVLYAANSLGRLGADFSMMIAMLEPNMKQELKSQALEKEKEEDKVDTDETKGGDLETTEVGLAETDSVSEPTKASVEPEWLRVIKKHRVQSARLDALAAGQDESSKRSSQDVLVR